jgi:hypothetical protein
METNATNDMPIVPAPPGRPASGIATHKAGLLPGAKRLREPPQNSLPHPKFSFPNLLFPNTRSRIRDIRWN